MTFAAALVEQAVFAAIPAAGFGLAFNVPARLLGWCALGGAVGRGLRFVLVHAGVSLPWATFLAAAAVSFLGVWAAQRIHAHPKVFTVAAVIPMVPGVLLFRTLLAISQMEVQGPRSDLVETALASGLQGSFVIGAIAVGLAVPGLFVYRDRPVI